MVGVGLFYREGYFHQLIDGEGWQRESNPTVDLNRTPVCLPHVPGGLPPIVELTIAGRSVSVLIRLVRVGRVPLLLLDTDLPENAPEDRDITARLYGGDQETRIRQETGAGDRRPARPGAPAGSPDDPPHQRGARGVRRAWRRSGCSSRRAADASPTRASARAAGNVFTTHTPVPAGIDHFAPELVEKYLASYVPGAGLSWEEFLRLGQDGPPNPLQPFSMAVLALRLCGHANAVSQLHARVSRRLWLGLLPELADEDVRIRAITNGVHRGHLDGPGDREAPARGRSGRRLPEALLARP